MIVFKGNFCVKNSLRQQYSNPMHWKTASLVWPESTNDKKVSCKWAIGLLQFLQQIDGIHKNLTYYYSFNDINCN